MGRKERLTALYNNAEIPFNSKIDFKYFCDIILLYAKKRKILLADIKAYADRDSGFLVINDDVRIDLYPKMTVLNEEEASYYESMCICDCS